MTIRRAFHSISQIPNLIPGSAVKQHPLDISYPPDIHQQLDICHLDNRNQAVIRQQLDICHLDMCHLDICHLHMWHLDICHLPDIHHPLDNYHWPDQFFDKNPTDDAPGDRYPADIGYLLDDRYPDNRYPANG